jgi:hypothetical protein
VIAMRAEQLRVELYPRSPWEAMELGIALVRTHARAIWLPWFVLSLPLVVLINGLCLWLGQAWWAALLVWWLKPVFDRIPLYVLSRAVFGDAPTLRETLQAQWRWGWRPMRGYLSWRRLGPARSLLLPVDLLEGGVRVADRRRVIGGAARGTAALLTLVCANFELVLMLATLALALMFVPVELLSESAKAAWALIADDPPGWVQVLLNAVTWLASSVIEPFYVGAGFGLYLDRRTRLEAWDVEIGLRRMRARLTSAISVLACAGVLALALPHSADAATPATTPATKVARDNTLTHVFARIEQDPEFARAVEATKHDPLLHPQRTQTVWVPINKEDAPTKPTQPAWLQAIAKAIALLGEYGLWLVMALLLGLLLATWRRWWPWLRGRAKLPAAVPSPVSSEAAIDAAALPADIVGSVRALWQQGRRRRALALLYRASVAAMVTQAGVVLVPGATEADCLRAARALPDAQARDSFAGMVRIWQYAAYAEQLPNTDAFDALLQRLAGSFGWRT